MATRLRYAPPQFGQLQIQTVANPAPGVDFANLFVPADMVYRLIALRFRLTASGVGANRYPRIAFGVPLAVAGIQVAALYTPITAGVTRNCFFGIGMGFGPGVPIGAGGAIGPNAHITGLPTQFDLPPGSAIVIGVQQLQPGDQLANYEALVRVWRAV